MVDNTRKRQEKKTVQIKATTGAWWKSTTVLPSPQEENSTSDPKEQLSNKSATNETRPRKASIKPKRPGSRRKSDQKLSATTINPAELENNNDPDNSSDLDSAAVEKEGKDKKTKAEKKPQRPIGKRGRKPKDSKKLGDSAPQTTEPQKDDITEDSHSEKGHNDASGRKETDKQTTRPDSTESAQQNDTLSQVSEGSNKETTQKHDEPAKVCKLLINAEEPEECRLALLENGRLESIHVSTLARTQTKNNIYKAKIVAIEPSLQAAFIEYGTDKNGFLPFSEIHPEYYKQNLEEGTQHLVDTHQWKKLNIVDVVEKGQEILAQVVKEEVGKKGANMTTFLSIPGRCVVLMPGSDSEGISRKISGEQRRSQLRETMKSMDMPEGIGWIVRTASVDITEKALSRDVEYLLKLWDDIKTKGQEMDSVGLIYEDHHNVLRFLREHYDPTIEEILVDDKKALEEVKSFIKMLPEDHQNVKVRLHQGARPIFNQYSVEDQIESIYQPQVNLPSGGSIVINPTEALVAIDVNSGSTSKGKNFEASIFQANLEAASELARQLRLRDLGGLIVVDFIDMRSKKHIIAVEKQVKATMKKDKAKVDFTRISKFGLMQISRQKLGSPIEAGNYRRCEHCKGRGTVRSVETLSLFYLRRIQTGASRKPVERIECHLPLDVASYLLNNKRTELTDMENRYKVEITIIAESAMKPAENEIVFHKAEKDGVANTN